MALVQFVRAHLVVRSCQGAKDDNVGDGDGNDHDTGMIFVDILALPSP